jgi:rod shape-determining protein MreD
MRRVLGAATLTVLAVMQVTWAPRLEVGAAYPNLVLLAVVAIAWTRGARAGLVCACAGGLLLDLTSSGPIGLHALALLAGVYVIGFWTRNLERASAAHSALTAAAATLLYSLLLVVADDALSLSIRPLGIAAQLAVTAALYNALLAPFALEIVRRLDAIGRSAAEPA